MLDTELKKTGTVLIHEGKIYTEGFEVDNCMCREVGIHAMLWAIGELQREIVETLKEGNQGTSRADLPIAVSRVLGFPEFFETVFDGE